MKIETKQLYIIYFLSLCDHLQHFCFEKFNLYKGFSIDNYTTGEKKRKRKLKDVDKSRRCS